MLLSCVISESTTTPTEWPTPQMTRISPPTCWKEKPCGSTPTCSSSCEPFGGGTTNAKKRERVNIDEVQRSLCVDILTIVSSNSLGCSYSFCRSSFSCNFLCLNSSATDVNNSGAVDQAEYNEMVTRTGKFRHELGFSFAILSSVRALPISSHWLVSAWFYFCEKCVLFL